MTFAVETKDLTKRYGDILAVDGMSLTVRQGEVYGFLGTNGAGKTTTLRMCSTLSARPRVRCACSAVRPATCPMSVR
jgi:ABC-2 type transport system ATP-binding protein